MDQLKRLVALLFVRSQLKVLQKNKEKEKEKEKEKGKKRKTQTQTETFIADRASYIYRMLYSYAYLLCFPYKGLERTDKITLESFSIRVYYRQAIIRH